MTVQQVSLQHEYFFIPQQHKDPSESRTSHLLTVNPVNIDALRTRAFKSCASYSGLSVCSS